MAPEQEEGLDPAPVRGQQAQEGGRGGTAAGAGREAQLGPLGRRAQQGEGPAAQAGAAEQPGARFSTVPKTGPKIVPKSVPNSPISYFLIFFSYF